MLCVRVILIIYLSYLSFAVELNIHKSVTEIRQVYFGNNPLIHLFKKDEYENLIADSINWFGTPFLKQELYNSINSLKDALVTVKRSSVCDSRTIPAKIIDPYTMLLENLETGSYFYAEKTSIEYQSTRPSESNTILTLQFGDRDYNGTLSYLIKGIEWTTNYDLSLTNAETCHLHGYAVIHNRQEQEYHVEKTCLFTGDLQLIKTRSPAVLRASAKVAQPQYNSSSKSIQSEDEEKGVYSYSLKSAYTLRPHSSVRLPFIDIIPQCQFYYKAFVSIRNGEYKGVFQRNYALTPNEFLPAGVVTIRDQEILIGQSNLPDTPQNYTQKMTVGQDGDVRYSIQSSFTSVTMMKSTKNSRIFELAVTISNFKNKEIKGQLEFLGSTRTILHETTCLRGIMNGNTFVLSINLSAKEVYQCRFNVTLK